MRAGSTQKTRYMEAIDRVHEAALNYSRTGRSTNENQTDSLAVLRLNET